MKIHILKRRIENEKLGIIFLQETKCSEDEIKVIGEKILQGSELIVVDAKGVARGNQDIIEPKRGGPL